MVSLKLRDTTTQNNSELIAWRGSAAVATKLDREGKNISERKRDMGKRKGRMLPVLDDANNDHYCCNKKSKTMDAAAAAPLTQSLEDDMTMLSPFIQYYRETFGSLWKSDVESAMTKPLPLTIRVLKPTCSLERELRRFGFRNVTEQDFTLHLSNHQKRTMHKKLDSAATQELLSNTWIMAEEDLYQSNALKKQHLGELNSMLPVSILTAILTKFNCYVSRGFFVCSLKKICTKDNAYMPKHKTQSNQQ